jgi:hypothetical protein
VDLFENLAFGRFDPSFFGLRLNLEGAIGSGMDPDLFQLTFTSFHYPIRDAHVKYVAGITDAKKLNLVLNLFTLSAHETKHFHDLLIAPYGSMLMRQYTRAALLFLTCKPDLILRSSTIILPLRNWVSDWEMYQAHDPAVTAPSTNVREFVSILELMQEKLKRFNAGNINLDGPFTAIDATAIVEGLAILVQERAIVEHFGAHQLAPFRAGFAPAARQRYYGALALVHRFLRDSASAETASLLLFASLCGNFQDTDSNHVRYPKDVLIEMLLWINEHCEDALRAPDLPKLGDAVDAYFEENLGDDLQGMLIRASRANREARESFAEMVLRFAESDSMLGSEGQRLLQQFENYSEIQTAFSANAFVNPYWYFSGDYLKEQKNLPKPIVYIECESGIPVDDTIEKLYYVQCESRIDISSFPESMRKKFTLDAINNVVRGAHIISPRYDFAESTKPDFGTKFTFVIPDLQVEVWHQNYDAVIGVLRFAIEGLDGPMIPAAQQEFLFALATIGVTLYSNGRQIPLPHLPDDWDSDVVDPVIRGYMREPRFREAMEELRKGKTRG